MVSIRRPRSPSRRPLGHVRGASLALGLALLGPLLPARVAMAQAAPGASEGDELAELRAKFQTALEREKANDYANALKLFRDVAGVRTSPQVLYHIAYCEEQLGHVVTALGGYARALEETTGDTPPAFVSEVKASMEALRARIPKLVLVRGSGAEAAKIEVDGEPIGEEKIGKELPQDPGPHRIVATATGFEPYDLNLTLAERQTERVVIQLTPKPEETAPPTGRVYGPWPFIIGGAGVLGLAAGAVLLPMSQDKAAQVTDLCGGTDCSSLPPSDKTEARALASEAYTLEVAGWVAGGVGAALLGTGLVMYLLDPGAQSEEVEVAPGVALKPSAPNSHAGVSLVGHF